MLRLLDDRESWAGKKVSVWLGNERALDGAPSADSSGTALLQPPMPNPAPQKRSADIAPRSELVSRWVNIYFLVRPGLWWQY
jgi:hypothetical protein